MVTEMYVQKIKDKGEKRQKEGGREGRRERERGKKEREKEKGEKEIGRLSERGMI